MAAKRSCGDGGSARGGAWNKQARVWEGSLEDLLRKHPRVAIAAAAAVGLALGWIVKRK